MAEVMMKGKLECLAKGQSDSWTKRYYVLLAKTERNQARLDWYDDEKTYKASGRSGDPARRKTIYIEEMAEVLDSPSMNNKKSVFTIACRDQSKPHTFNATDNYQKRQWMVNLKNIIETCGMGSKVGPNVSPANSLEDSNENSDYEMCEKPRNFRITMQNTAASERLGFRGDYDLIIGLTNIQLKDISDHQTKCSWPMRGIRRYGKSKTNFTFESGRRCETGDGMWKLQTQQGEEIFNLFQRNTNEMRKREKENPTRKVSLDPDEAPQLPDRNYNQGNYVEIQNEAKPKTPLTKTKSDPKKDQSLPHSQSIDGSTYANVEESGAAGEGTYYNEKRGPSASVVVGEYGEAAQYDTGPTYEDPDVMNRNTRKKMSDAVAEIKRKGQARNLVEGGEYDQICFKQQHQSAPLTVATGNTYDRLDSMGTPIPESTYSEIGNVYR